jgi:uncharacterized membrane protein
MKIINYLSLGISIVGIAIIVWGVLLCIRQFISLELQLLEGADVSGARETPRKNLSSYLLLGLEFLVAADIIRTIVRPSLKDLAVLGSIVAIRTVLNYFLNLELRQK